MSDTIRHRLAWGLLAACAAVFGWLMWKDATAHFPTDRERVNIALGIWSSRFLVATLAVTPVSVAMREPGLRRLRRDLGLAAFAFALVHSVHYVVYAGLWPQRLAVLVRRPYLTVGVVALLLFIPLALTSSNWAARRLRPERWRALHRLVYPAAVLSVLHALMGWAKPMGEMGLHALALSLLLVWRIGRGRRLAPRRRPLQAELSRP